MVLFLELWTVSHIGTSLKQNIRLNSLYFHFSKIHKILNNNIFMVTFITEDVPYITTYIVNGDGVGLRVKCNVYID